ncbi:MAG TPA: NAD(+)/NADH kinase [Dehalococcoidia bacterium]|nr:NAD(+)/NADH kinase [Dehalococcoidia bacterium]
MTKKVGVLFQSKIEAAGDLAQQMAKVVGALDVDVWTCSAWDEDRAREQVEGTDIVICLGGDGTILRASRVASPLSIPILGVNLGRIGFMTELNDADALSRVPDFIKGKGWVEERAMLQSELEASDKPAFYALNDVVIGRGAMCRLIRIKAAVYGELLTTYKCDGLILATATGSTAYALAAGGPILHPHSGEILMKPIAAHLSFGTALVLPADATVELEVNTTHQAMLSIDGQVEVPLSDGDIIRVKRSPHVTRLLRAQRPMFFYGTLMRKLEKRE